MSPRSKVDEAIGLYNNARLLYGCHDDVKHLRKSLCYVRSSLAINPHSILALILMGRILGAMGRRAEALKSYKSAIKLNPVRTFLSEIYHDMADINLAQRRYREALTLINKSFASWTNISGKRALTWMYDTKAEILNQLGNRYEAINLINQAVINYPDQSSDLMCTLRRLQIRGHL